MMVVMPWIPPALYMIIIFIGRLQLEGLSLQLSLRSN